MHPFCRFGAALTVLALAAGSTPQARADESRSAAATSPIVVKVLHTDVVIDKDGRYATATRIEVTASNTAAAAQIAQATIPYRESVDDLRIDEAYTQKADGQKLKVDTGAIFPQMPRGAPNEPMFDDQRQKVIVFPNVQAGDTVVYAVTVKTKTPFFPQAFFQTWLFPRTVAYGDVTVSIAAPSRLALKFNALGGEVEKRPLGNDRTEYGWRYTNPQPAQAVEQHAVQSIARVPRLEVSSFADYDALSHAFAKAALPKAQVTVPVRKLAEEVTAGVRDRREQAKRLYEWVSSNIRYVSVGLGIGTIIPHDAATTLKNGYGDCKDKAVLLKALLAAKGIESDIVLINYGVDYELTGVPDLFDLNHAINWLPEFGIYADATAEVAPFGALPFAEYGKPVVHVVSSGTAVHQVPVLEPGQAAIDYRTSQQMDKAGRRVGTTTITATGSYSIGLKQLAKAIQSNGAERVAASYFARAGEKGSGTFSFDSPSAAAQTFRLSGQFDVTDPTFLNGRGFALPVAYRFFDTVGDNLAGPLFASVLPDDEPTPCFSGKQSEELSFWPPENKEISRLPSDTQVTTPYFHYASHWIRNGREVMLTREFVTTFHEPLCTGEVRRDVAKGLAEVRKDYDSAVALSALSQSYENEAHELDRAVAAAPKNAVAHMNRASALGRLARFDEAIADLDEAIALDGNYWSAYVERARAYLDLARRDHGRYELAVADLAKAIALNKDDAEEYSLRADADAGLGEMDKVREDIAAAAKAAPNDPRVYTEAVAACERLPVSDPITAEQQQVRKTCFAEAVEGLDGAVARLKPDIRLFVARGRAGLALSDLPHAAADIAAAERINGQDARALTLKAAYLVQSGRASEAVPIADKLVGRYPNDLAYVQLRLQALVRSKQFDRALADATALLNSAPNDARRIAERAWIMMQQHNYAEAIAEFSRADALEPNNARVLENRASSYFGNREYRKALADYQRVKALDPGHRDIQTLISETEKALGKVTVAQ